MSCGTYAGYQKHLRSGEPTCPECRQANTTYKQLLKWGGVPWEHGTNAGYLRHRKEGNTVCDPCREAKRDYSRMRREKLKKPQTRPGWDLDAACKDNPEPFFALTDEDVRLAIAICETCPVIDDCAKHRLHAQAVVNGPATGVWAGVHWVADNTTSTARKAKRPAA